MAATMISYVHYIGLGNEAWILDVSWVFGVGLEDDISLA